MRLSPALSLVAVSAAALALAACSGEGGAGGDAPSVETALADLEHPLPGLWEHEMGDGAGTAFTAKFCVGAPEPGDNPFASSSTGGEEGEDADCPVQELRRAADGLHFRSVCNMGEGGTLTSEGKVTGDLKRAYRVEVSMKTAGVPIAPGMPSEGRMVVNARRIGDCPAGVEPGAMVP